MKVNLPVAQALLSLVLFLPASPADGARKVGNIVWRPIDEKKALVYVIREWAFGGGGRTVFLYIDNQFAGTLDNGTYTAFYAEPGNHELIVLSALPPQKVLSVHLEAGKEYFALCKYSKGELIFLDSESGRKMAQKVKSYVEPSEEEIREIKEALFYTWDPILVDRLVEEIGDRLVNVKPRTLEEINAIVNQKRDTHKLPPGSLGEVVVLAELADLGAAYSLQEDDLERARELLKAAISGYAVAADRFDFIQGQEAKKEWKGIIALGVLGAVAPAQVSRKLSDLSAQSELMSRDRERLIHLGQAADARKFKKEAERRLACVENGENLSVVHKCIEEH
jgi:hypothetical protein